MVINPTSHINISSLYCGCTMLCSISYVIGIPVVTSSISTCVSYLSRQSACYMWIMRCVFHFIYMRCVSFIKYNNRSKTEKNSRAAVSTTVGDINDPPHIAGYLDLLVGILPRISPVYSYYIWMCHTLKINTIDNFSLY